MSYSVRTRIAGDAAELRSIAAGFAAEPAGEVVLTLSATTDPAARDRGLVAALRAALETAAEPPPQNLRNAWGDWPHDLFEAIGAQAESFKGLGAVAVARPNGVCDLVQIDGPVSAAAYYLSQPITFPMDEAAAGLEPVVALELHRTHAVVRRFEGTRANGEYPIAGLEAFQSGKTGAEGQEHAERRTRELEGHYLREVAKVGAEQAEEARAIVVAGDQELRRGLRDALATPLPLAEIDWAPDRSQHDWALAVQGAATAALGEFQASSIRKAREADAPVEDWPTAAMAAHDGRLHEVWLNPSVALHLNLCSQCGTAADNESACANCGSSPSARLPAPEYVVRGAKATGAVVHFATGEAAELLKQGTGIVGRWRY